VKPIAWSVCLALAMLLAPASRGQVNESFADLADEIENARELIQTERKAVVGDVMQLTGEENVNFWPVYDEYRAAMVEVNDRLIAVITDYAADADTLTEARAKNLLQRFLKQQADVVALKRRYERRFLRMLPAVKVVRFYQIDNKLDAVINLGIAAQVPLAE
jgi:hypothetical protein